MKQTLVALAMLLCAAGAAAQTALSVQPAGAPVPTPDQVVRQGIDRLTGFLIGARDAEPEVIRDFLNHEIAPAFDFAYMARWAAGPLYRRMNTTQHARLTDKLRELFLAALARNLGSYARPLPHIDVLSCT